MVNEPSSTSILYCWHRSDQLAITVSSLIFFFFSHFDRRISFRIATDSPIQLQPSQISSEAISDDFLSWHRWKEVTQLISFPSNENIWSFLSRSTIQPNDRKYQSFRPSRFPPSLPLSIQNRFSCRRDRIDHCPPFANCLIVPRRSVRIFFPQSIHRSLCSTLSPSSSVLSILKPVFVFDLVDIQSNKREFVQWRTNVVHRSWLFSHHHPPGTLSWKF